jgi:hypothetical protein
MGAIIVDLVYTRARFSISVAEELRPGASGLGVDGCGSEEWLLVVGLRSRSDDTLDVSCASPVLQQAEYSFFGEYGFIGPSSLELSGLRNY